MVIQHKIQTGFAIALVFLLVTGAMTWWSARRNVETFRAVDHTYQVIARLQDTLVEVLNTETGSRGFALSGDADYLQPYQTGTASVQEAFAAVRQLTRDNPAQQQRLAALWPLIEKRIALADELVKERRGEGQTESQSPASLGEGRQAMQEIRKIIGEMQDEEERLEQQRTEKAEALSRWTLAIAGLGSLAAIVLVALAGGLVQRDFRRRQEAEQALRRSEENLSVTLQSIGDAVLATDASGRVTRLNPVAEKLTGWTQAEALGRPVDEVFSIINEETRRPAVIPVAAVLATGEIQGLANHTVVIARNGVERPIADSAAPIRDKEGKVLGVVLVFRDVSEEKKTEQALRASEQKLQQFNDELAQLVEDRSVALQESERLARAALDALTAHVAILDERGVIMATNQGWQDFANQNGLSLKEAGKGTNYLGACARAAGQSASAAKMAGGIRDVIAGRKNEFTLEYDCHSPTEKRWFLCRVTRFAGDGAVRVVVAHENITQMRLLERQQIRSQRMESLGTLASGMAHDFNNALSPIMVGMQMLKEKYPGESEIMDMFYVSTKRGADMVRQLLAFARGAEGERNPVQLERLVHEMENIISGSFPKNIRLTVECDPQLPSVLGDTTQLHQVILNLCVNARDAMPDGGTLTLEARGMTVDAVLAGGVPEARPGKYVALRVRDTGTGIPPDVLDRIFDPFFTTKALGKGTGLGLSTVTGIVKGHSGFMKVYSQPGQGSTFTVFLPANDTIADAGAKVDGVAGEAFTGSGETILVVDDEPAIRQIMAAVLQRLNLKVVTAADGRDGLARLAGQRDELRAVITDLHMPNMGGLEFVRQLRRMLPDVPVALTSGRLEKNEEDEFQALNVTVCLNKPFAEGELAAVLQKLLNAAKARS